MNHSIAVKCFLISVVGDVTGQQQAWRYFLLVVFVNKEHCQHISGTQWLAWNHAVKITLLLLQTKSENEENVQPLNLSIPKHCTWLSEFLPKWGEHPAKPFVIPFTNKLKAKNRIKTLKPLLCPYIFSMNMTIQPTIRIISSLNMLAYKFSRCSVHKWFVTN